MEIATIDKNEMISESEVETTIATENLIENTTEHEFNKYLLKRNAETLLEHIEIKESEFDDNSVKRLKTIENEATTSTSTIATTNEFLATNSFPSAHVPTS